MKAQFKKIDLLLHHRDRERIISMLQELGVIHLELNTDFRNEDIEELELQKTRLTKAIEFVSEYKDEDSIVPIESNLDMPSVDRIVDDILNLKHQKETDQQEEELLRKNKQKLQPWGNFDPNKLHQLSQAGVQVFFCIADKKEYEKENLASFTYQVIYESSDRLYLVVLSMGEAPSLPFETVQLPSMQIADIKSKEKQLDRNKVQRAETIYTYLSYLPLLSQELVRIENQLALQLANGSCSEYAEGSILHLKGWFPATMEGRLLQYIKKENLSYTLADPTPEDKVPVLLKNPQYPKLFESITRIFQLPGYYEMDLTPFIAVFYPILFAYCLGDAGYGLILFTVSKVGWFTFWKKSRNMAVLGMILGAFTTLMGVVKSGSIFGLPIVGSASNPMFQYLSQYVIIPDDRGVVFNAFNVALLIGVVQIITGIIISIVNKIKYKSMIAGLPQIGKLFIVTSLIWMFLADMQGVEALQPFGVLRMAILSLGVLLVLFFHDMKVPVLTRAASGILPLFFILTGILGDVLSYVRLFALGVASSVLGLVVNQIGMQIMGDSWWGVLLGVVFLLLGHSLNFALAALGSFVHPLRLTFVEFYNNAQFEGGGIPYQPLRKINLSHSK